MLISDKYRQFARDLVTSGELDPMYDFMYTARNLKGDEWADKYALYLFMFYDARGALAAAYSLDFWQYVFDNYNTAKRGSERRHFRGTNGANAITNLRAKGSPTAVWNDLYKPHYVDLYQNADVRFAGCQMGDYFRWKAMDIFDRTMGQPVSLGIGAAIALLPDSPRDCAKAVYPNCELKDVLLDISSWIDDLPAPGAPTRNCGIPEAETVMCAIRGLEKGSYKFGEDITLRHLQLKGLPEVQWLSPKQDWSKYGPY
jgi:hypothetical protein